MKIIHYPELSLRYFCQDKNASTTMERYFETLTQVRPTFWDVSTIAFSETWNRSRQSVVEVPVEQEFTIIRNTYDRMASIYRMLVKQIERNGAIDDWFDRYREPIMAALGDDDPFTAFVRFATSLDDQHIETHWQCQYHHLPFHSPRFHVVRLERLSEDLARAGGFLATIDLAKAGHQNDTASTGPSYRELFTEEAKALVDARYWKEIEIFGFQF